MGAIINKTAYEMTSSVNSGEVDIFNRLTVSALMKRQQDIGELHLNEFGTTSKGMRETQGLAFIFTKLKIKVYRLPSVGETVSLTTWCSALKGVRFTRNYILRDEKGELLTESKAEVTTIDLSTRKIVRPSAINGLEGFLYNEDLQNGCDYPQKLHCDGQEDYTYSYKISTDDIDFNGHVNNTVYAAMSFDLIAPLLKEKSIKGFEINFNNEALLGDTVKLGYRITENGYVVMGEVNEKSCFMSKIEI